MPLSKRTIKSTQRDISLFCRTGKDVGSTLDKIQCKHKHNTNLILPIKKIKNLLIVIKIKLIINVPFHSIARSLPPPAGHGHRKPLKCGQPLALTLQEMTVQQATQMHPADTSGPCGFHEQTDCEITRKVKNKAEKDT